MNIFEKLKHNVISNPIIKKIISDLNLNDRQINSGINIFLKIIEENKHLNELEFITKVEIYDDNSVIEISVPNKEVSNVLKRRKNRLLRDITDINDFTILKPLNSANEKINIKNDVNNFFWIIPNKKESNDRKQLALWYKDFLKNLSENRYTKGAYIHGPMGTGKTFFLNALANLLSEKDRKVIFANVNDLFDYLTNNIDSRGEGNNFEICQIMKSVDILIIDDIGSEKRNSWFLFSILYPILEYREKNKKATCFSSLFNYLELKKYWTKSKDLDPVKIERLIDKITSLTTPIHLKGDNLRKL